MTGNPLKKCDFRFFYAKNDLCQLNTAFSNCCKSRFCNSFSFRTSNHSNFPTVQKNWKKCRFLPDLQLICNSYKKKVRKSGISKGGGCRFNGVIGSYRAPSLPLLLRINADQNTKRRSYGDSNTNNDNRIFRYHCGPVCPGNTLCTRGSGLKNDADLFISMDEGGQMIRSRSPTG